MTVPLMEALTPQQFKAIPLLERLEVVRERGEYIGSRSHVGHRVHLYVLDGFCCEVWMRLGLFQVEWIEVATNVDILSEYVKLDTKDLLRSSGGG